MRVRWLARAVNRAVAAFAQVILATPGAGMVAPFGGSTGVRAEQGSKVTAGSAGAGQSTTLVSSLSCGA